MKQLKIAAALLSFLAAGLVLHFNRAERAQALPDTAESSTTWMCAACKKVYRLTAAEAERQAVKGGGPSPLLCPACSARKAYRAAECLNCRSLYFSSDVPDSPGRCLRCYPHIKGEDLDRPGTEDKKDSNRKPPPPSA